MINSPFSFFRGIAQDDASKLRIFLQCSILKSEEVIRATLAIEHPSKDKKECFLQSARSLVAKTVSRRNSGRREIEAI